MSALTRGLSVRDTAKACMGMFRMRLIHGMQYRAAAWAGVATQFAWGFMLLAVFHAFYAGSTADPGMTYEELAAYNWLRQAFLALLTLWYADGDLLASITNGQVAYELCRPVPMYAFWYARLLGTRLASVAMRVGPLLLIVYFLPQPFRMPLPPSWEALGLFLLSMALAALLTIALSMFVYILTFITLSPAGARSIFGMIGDFMAGLLIPLPLMPAAMQKVLDFFPFRYTLDFPFRVYSGNIAGADAVFGMAVQALWLASMVLLGAFLFGRAQKKLVIQGG